MSFDTKYDAVAEWKRQRREVFVPLTYRPGDLAEVDFFEVLVDVNGTRRKAWLFLMRLMYSGRDFAWIYVLHDSPAPQGQWSRQLTLIASVPALAIPMPGRGHSDALKIHQPGAQRGRFCERLEPAVGCICFLRVREGGESFVGAG